MNEESGGLDAMAAFDLAPAFIEYHQITRGHFGPVQPLGIDQEMPGAARDLHAEMVADAFAETQPVRPAQRRGEVDTRLLLGRDH